MNINLGIAPIAWSNDDMPELGGDTPIETCLFEAKSVGYSGIEARVRVRVQRTSPSASTIFESLYMGNHTSGISAGFLWSGTTIDESLGSGDHIYQIQYKKHVSGDVYYLGFSPSTNGIVIQVIK